MLAVSCDVLHTDKDSIDGFWQLVAVDTLATGTTADMRESQVTWAVQGSLLEVRIADSFMEDFVFKFEHTSNSLKLLSPYQIDRDHGDVKVVNVDLLRPFGINELEENFTLIQLSGSQLILESSLLRLHFRNY